MQCAPPENQPDWFDNGESGGVLLFISFMSLTFMHFASAKLARAAGWNVMVSHRSGETSDTFIADLSVGLGVGQIKSGAPCRSERVAKYNRLIRYAALCSANAAMCRIENDDPSLKISTFGKGGACS